MVRATAVPVSQVVSGSVASRARGHHRAAKPVTRLAVVVLLLLGLAVAIDRLSLWMWRWQVHHYYEGVRNACEAVNATGDLPLPLVLCSGSRREWQVPLLGIVIEGPSPRIVIVDGNGGLNLLYTPPYTAWTRHLPYAGNRAFLLEPDSYPFNDVYLLRIDTVEDRPAGKDLPRPSVHLDHGIHD